MLFRRPELAPEHSAADIISGLQMAMSAGSSENRKFSLVPDAAGYVERLVKLLPVSALFPQPEEQTAARVAELLSGAHDVRTCLDLLVFSLCERTKKSDLAFSHYAAFLERAVLTGQDRAAEKVKESALLPLLCYPGFIKERFSGEEKERDRPVGYPQYSLASSYNENAKQLARSALSEIFRDDPLFRLAAGQTPTESIAALIRRCMEDSKMTDKVVEQSEIVLALPQKLWDIGTGFYLSALILVPS